MNRKLWLFFGSLGLSMVAGAMFVFLLLRPIPIDSVSFSVEEISLKAGEACPLSYSYLPEEATKTELSFMSSNRAVATVENGVLTAVSEGSCYISITAESGTKDTLRVEVVAPMLPQEETLVGRWLIFATMNEGKLKHLYNDDSSLTLTEDRSGHLIYGKEEYRFPDWRFTEKREDYYFFDIKDENQQAWKMYFCTNSASSFEKSLLLQLPSGETLLFQMEEAAE